MGMKFTLVNFIGVLTPANHSQTEKSPKYKFDPWQVVPRQVFTPYFCLLVSIAIVVVSRVGCLGVAAVL